MTIPSKHSVLFLFIPFIFACGSHEEQKKKTTQEQNKLETIDLEGSAELKDLTYTEAYNKALTLWRISFEEKEIKTSLGIAHVIIAGPVKGEPLVLLHGMNASSTMWYPNVQSLSKQYRIYAIDFLLEPGKSSCETNVNSTDQLVNWYYEIFDQLKLKKTNLLGASRGGWMALNIALHSQSRINKIVLLSPAQAFTWIKPQPKVLRNITYTLSPKRKRLRSVLETMTFDVDNISQTYINQYYIATKEATINKCILQMTPFSDNELESLKMPILVLIGDHDIINNEKSLAKAKKLLPNAETEIIKNAGHFLSIDQAEYIDKKILSFLNANNSLSAKK